MLAKGKHILCDSYSEPKFKYCTQKTNNNSQNNLIFQ